MRNDDTRQAVTFHDMTKYYPLSDTKPGDERIGIGDPTKRTEAIWQKDWDIKPFLYKAYETVPIPPDTRPARHRPGGPRRHRCDRNARSGVARRSRPGAARSPRPAANGSLDRAWTTRDGRVHHYRTAGGTGAQYHLELYFVCTELADLGAGVYHYSHYSRSTTACACCARETTAPR